MRPVVDGRSVRIEAASDLPAVLVDREMMEMAFRQLIDNAVKYSLPGEPITITSSVEDGQVLTRVRDRGRGIPEGATANFEILSCKECRQQFEEPGSAAIASRGNSTWWKDLGGSEPGMGSTFCVALAEVRGMNEFRPDSDCRR